MVQLGGWSRGRDLCDWGHKGPGMIADVQVSCFAHVPLVVVLVCQVRGAIVCVLREVVCHHQHRLPESVG